MRQGTSAQENERTVIPHRGPTSPAMAVATVDLDDLNSPHTMAVLSIPPGARVLDVGCGAGIVAKALAARGCKVWGLEIDHWLAASARNFCVEVLEVDVESVTLSTALAGMTFDAVIFLDVLEHLRDPHAVLADAAAVLAPGGTVLLSIPNVTHGALRLELLSGKFRYRASGLLDRGHLRFFDADGVDELVRLAGFHTETRLRVIRRLDQTEFDIDLASIPSALRSTLESDPDALTYQFFVIARPAPGPHSFSAGISLVERQQARIGELAAELEKGSGYARHLQEELAAKDVRLRDIEGTVATSERARLELAAAVERGSAQAAHLQEALAATTARLSEVQGTLEDTHRQMEAKTVRLTGVEGAFADIHDQLETRGTRLREVEGAFATIEHELEAKTARLAEVEGAFATIEHELKARASRLTEVEGALAHAHDQLETRGARLREAEGAFAALEHELEATTARLTEVEGARAHAHDQLETRGARLREVEDAFATSERELEATTVRLAHREQVLADLRRVSEDHESYIRHLEAELRKRTGDIAIRDDAMSVLRTHIERAERTIAEREREIALRDDAMSALRTHIERAESTIGERERETALRDVALDGLRARIDRAETALTEREARLQAAERSAVAGRELAAELSMLLQQPRHRFAENSNNTLKRWMPVLHHLLRRMFASAPSGSPDPPGPDPHRGAD